DTETGKGGDEVSESEGSEEESNDEKDQELRLSEEARIQEEEEADELYRDVNINQGRGLHVTQNVEDSHVTLTSVNLDGPQESSSMSSFVTSMLNPTCDRLRSLETSFFEYRQTNPFVDAVSTIFADLSEMELKKILIEKMEGNKSTQRSDEQRNLYKALVEAYDADKAILDTYGDSTIMKRRREDDDQEGPSAGSDRGSKRQKEGGEHASASTPSETATGVQADLPKGLNLDNCLPVSLLLQRNLCRLPVRWRNLHIRCLKQVPMINQLFKHLTAQGDAQSWIRDLARQTDAHSSFNELLDTPIDFSNFIMNQLNVDTLTPELL
nr:hypothetical protein [Tanacetum cinerariifolium]